MIISTVRPNLIPPPQLYLPHAQVIMLRFVSHVIGILLTPTFRRNWCADCSRVPHCAMLCQVIATPDSKVHGANMGPTWGRQDLGGPYVGHVNLAIWVRFSHAAITLSNFSTLKYKHRCHNTHCMR